MAVVEKRGDAVGEERTGVGREADRSDDLVLLAELRGMLDRVDPPPAWLEELARQSYGLRAVDLEVAELVADSQVDRPAVAVRATTGPAEPRLLSFEADGRLVDLEVSYGERGPELAGQLVPASSATVELRRPGRATLTVAADDRGRFTVTDLDTGPLSLVCRWAGSAVLALPWILV
jgi:hypothetical protein